MRPKITHSVSRRPITWFIGCLLALLLAATLDACSADLICLDPKTNFSLNDVRYDDTLGRLSVTGSQVRGICYHTDNETEKYSLLLLTVDLKNLTDQTEVMRSKTIEDVDLPVTREWVFGGEFRSSCNDCSLQMHFGNGNYSLQFLTAPRSGEDPVLMILQEGDKPIGSYAFRMEQIVRL